MKYCMNTTVALIFVRCMLSYVGAFKTVSPWQPGLVKNCYKYILDDSPRTLDRFFIPTGTELGSSKYQISAHQGQSQQLNKIKSKSSISLEANTPTQGPTSQNKRKSSSAKDPSPAALEALGAATASIAAGALLKLFIVLTGIGAAFVLPPPICGFGGVVCQVGDRYSWLYPNEVEAICLRRMLVALGTGAVIGTERSMSMQAAGFRTLTLVSMASALFTMVGIFGFGHCDQARMAAAVAAGVGFIGAGVITKASTTSPHDTHHPAAAAAGPVGHHHHHHHHHNYNDMDVHLPLGQVRGVSTAASIWTAAGLGVTAGIGFSHLAIYTALMTVAILRVTQSGAGMFQRQTRANTWHLRRRARNLGRLVRRFFPTTRAAKAEEGHDQPHQDPPRNTVQQGKYSMNSLKASPQDFHSLSAGSFSNTQRWETDETDASQDSISPTELLQVANETVLIAGTASEEQQILFAGDKLPKNLDICDVNKLSRNGFNIVRTGDWLFVNGTSPHGPAGVSTSYMEKLMDS